MAIICALISGKSKNCCVRARRAVCDYIECVCMLGVSDVCACMCARKRGWGPSLASHHLFRGIRVKVIAEHSRIEHGTAG